jgi:predicted dehydrogenase
MIMEKSEPYIGIMIEYDRSKVVHKEKISTSGPRKNELSLTLRPSPVSIGFIGAGSYAQSYLLPNIPKSKDTVLKGVMTATSAGSRSVADRFGFEFCTGNEDDILTNDQINTVFIATRHDTHGHYVKKALAARKHVFVEKPLCLCPEELSQIMEIYTPLPLPYLMVGFNRRFASLTTTLLDKIGTGAMSMIYRINAGVIQSDSWVQDNKVGGGRVIGEVCHFVDYLTFINGSLPVSVYAAAMSHAQNNNDTLTISLRFANGSIGSIQYFANGSKALPKEYIEIYNHGVTAIIADFRELIIYGDRKPLRKKLLTQDKGQKNEVREFIEMILKGGPPLISPEEIFSTTNVTFKILESLKTGKVIDL